MSSININGNSLLVFFSCSICLALTKIISVLGHPERVFTTGIQAFSLQLGFGDCVCPEALDIFYSFCEWLLKLCVWVISLWSNNFIIPLKGSLLVMLILVGADRLLKKKSYWSQKKFFPVNCALHFTFSSPAVTAPQNSSLSPLCGSYVNCSLGRKQSKGKDREELIPGQSHSFLRGLTYEPQTFLSDGLHAGPAPRVRASCKLAVLAAPWSSRNRHRRAAGVCHKYLSCASGSHTRLLQTAYAAPRETRNSISKEITSNSSHAISFLSRNDIYEGIITFLLSLLCILYGLHDTSPVKDLLCFCLGTSAILFSLVEIVPAIIKDQLKYHCEKKI